jgi:hypothetical protein
MTKVSESVMCKIEGCGRKAMYREQQVCQKHYFRFMRNGTYERAVKRMDRRQDARGYWQMYMPEHPLADSTGQVWEHRKIVYERYGDNLPPCELCGKPVTWKTVHIDHEDENRSNNDPKNLRPLCRGCNVSRPVRADAVLLTINGVTKNVLHWAEESGCTVCDTVIRNRVKAGWPHDRAVFDPPRSKFMPTVMNKKARRLEKRIAVKNEVNQLGEAA